MVREIWKDLVKFEKIQEFENNGYSKIQIIILILPIK